MLLLLFLYPLASLFWERHCSTAIRACGFEKVIGWECVWQHKTKGLFLSIYEGDIEAVLKALDDSPERLDKKLVGHNCNPFGLAARYGHTKLVEALLERDPDLIGEVPGPHRHSSKELTHHTV